VDGATDVSRAAVRNSLTDLVDASLRMHPVIDGEAPADITWTIEFVAAVMPSRWTPFGVRCVWWRW